MVGKPAVPPELGGTEQAEHAEHDRTCTNEQSQERIGPVTVERLHKDDGRALILYSSIERAAHG